MRSPSPWTAVNGLWPIISWDTQPIASPMHWDLTGTSMYGKNHRFWHNMHNMHHVFQYQYYHTRLCLNFPAECEWLLTSCEIFSTFVKFSSHKCPLRCIVNLCRVPIIACDTLWHMQPHERQMFSSGFSNHHNYIIMISNQILISPQCSHFWERSLLFWLLHLYKIPFSLFSFYKVLIGKVCILASLPASLQVVCISLFCICVHLCGCASVYCGQLSIFTQISFSHASHGRLVSIKESVSSLFGFAAILLFLSHILLSCKKLSFSIFFKIFVFN